MNINYKNEKVMLKISLTSFICVFLLLCGYAQDTTPVATKDTVVIVADSVSMDALSSTSNHIEGKKHYTYQSGPIYKLKPGIDIPVVAVGTGWTLYAFTKVYSKDAPGEETIGNLKKSDINRFDRWAVRPYSKTIDRISYIPFFASMPAPLFFLAGERTRKDFFKLAFLYWEAMSITGLLYTTSTYFIDRYRPYAYSTETAMPQRNRGGAKNSFYAGHVALVATSTFFMAKVYADYHPESKAKWVFYTLASGITGATAYLRHKAGQHFPSDLLLGAVQGTLTGILVPHFHKNKLIKDPNLSIIPFTTGESNGLALIYKL